MLDKVRPAAQRAWAATLGRFAFSRTRWFRRTIEIVAVVLIVFSLIGFVGVPLIAQYVVVPRVAAALHRPVSIARVRFNPYRLRLRLKYLHIGNRDSQAPFVDIHRLHVTIEWRSLLHLAPIVHDVSISRPIIHVVREAEQTFNFSDLLERPAPTPAPAPSQPQRFAVSNIKIHEGQIYFDDDVTRARHLVDHVELHIPFIANLPWAVDVYVQPLLEMVVDGSRLRIAGRTRPFANPPDSTINLNLHQLGIPLYVGYLPEKIPVRIPEGSFSSQLQMHFISTPNAPEIRLDGEMAIDNLDVRDAANVPLIGFKHLAIALDEIQPLVKIVHLGRIYLDGLDLNLVRYAGGSNNFAAIGQGKAPPRAAPAAPPAPTAPPHVTAQGAAVPTPGVQGASQGGANLAAAAPRASATAGSAASAVSTGAAQAASTMTPPASAARAAKSPLPAATSGPSATASASSVTASAPNTSPAATGSGKAPASPAPATTSQLSAGAPGPSPVAIASPQPPPAAGAAAGGVDFALGELALTNATIKVTDRSVAPPAALTLGNLHLGLKNFRTMHEQGPASFDFGTTLGGGGTIGARGALDLAAAKVASDISLDAIDLPALQGFAQPFIAAIISSGKLTAHAKVQTVFATGKFNMHAAPASVSFDKFQLRAPNQSEIPIEWNKLSANISAVDLATRQATVSEVRSDGLHAFVRRERDGRLSVTALLRETPSPPAAPAAAVTPATAAPTRRERIARRERHLTRRAKSVGHKAASVVRGAPMPTPAPAPANAWHYQVASVAMEKTEIRVEDDSVPRPVTLEVAPLNLHLKNVSDDLAKPIAIDLDGVLNRRGRFKVTGNAAPDPLKANLRVITRRLDLAPFDQYVTGHLNAKIASALLTVNGAVEAGQQRKAMRVGYRGDAAIGSVRLIDKLTNDSFMRWSEFSARRIDFRTGAGAPRVHIGALALDNFYARVILNSDGRLNLRDITTSPQEAPTSLTRAHGEPGSVGVQPSPSPAPTPAPTSSPVPTPSPVPSSAGAINGSMAGAPTPAAPAAAPSPAPLPADIEIGQIELSGGHLNYSDNFIKPNYSADLTDITGKIGEFGTASSKPAPVEVKGEVNGNAPLDISGSINPLTPLAFVDITAKANGVELTNVSTYSAKYTGYPITGGTLTVDVHYLLDQQKLTAQNHIVIDQLTFGDKVESKSAINLPIRLAVAILKNPQGQIDLSLPVSGSLSDPHFSIGGVLLHAFMGLLVKAVTSPFNLLASTVGGIAGSTGANQNLNYVVFAPGAAAITPTAETKLEAVGKVLQARPALQVSITGRVDPKSDRAALPAALVDLAIARQQVLANDQNPATTDLWSVKVMPDEYNKYLRRAYKAAKFDKPKDLLGLDKSLDPEEMKKLMIANTHVTDDDLKRLADARASAVRKVLATRIAPARLHVAAPKLTTEGIKDNGPTMRADLSLE